MSFSLRGLLLTVPIIALGVSGFVFASPWASSLTYTICMAVLFFAVVAVLFARSERRLLWAGFAAFGWGYWFLAFEGTNHEQSRQIAMRPALRFVTSDVIDALERFRSSSYPSGSRVLVEWQGTYWPATTGGTTVAGDRYLIDWGDGSPSIWANPSQIMPFSPHSRHAAHSLFCLSFGLIGAMASVWTLRDCTFSKEEAPDVAG